MEGWVSKKRPTGVGKFKMWQKRYLILNSEHLAYFGENERKKPKAQLRLNELESVSLVISEKKPDHSRFDVVCRPVVIPGSVKNASEKDTMKRVYSFRASNAEEAKKWVSLISALAFGENMDAAGDLDIAKPVPLVKDESSASSPVEAANLREVICDRIYNALNMANILSPAAALTESGDKPKSSYMSNGGYLCANENSTEDHVKMMIFLELGSDTELLRFLCGQFYNLLCNNNRDGYDSRSRTHSFSISASQQQQPPQEPLSPLSASPSGMNRSLVKCALKTCKNMRCRLPGFLGFRSALEPREMIPQQQYCTEHAELWIRTSYACGKCLQSTLLADLAEKPPDVLLQELNSVLAEGTPDAKGVACRLLWVILPVYLERKAKHKRAQNNKRLADQNSDRLSTSEALDEFDPDSSRHSMSGDHSRPSTVSETRPSMSGLGPLPSRDSPRPPADWAALEERSVVRTMAMKTFPKHFATLMSQHCSGQEYSLPIKNALTAIMLRPSARMLKLDDLDNEEQAAMHMVVHHDGACWLAFMVALKGSPFALREQSLKEVNMLLIENPGNCSNFKRQRNWPWLIYSLLSDIPSAVLGQQAADEHEELTRARESGIVVTNAPAGREFPSLSFSYSANEDASRQGPAPSVSNSPFCFPASPPNSELTASDGAQSTESEGTKLSFDGEQQPKRGSLTVKLLPPMKIERSRSSPAATNTTPSPASSSDATLPQPESIPDMANQPKRGSLKRVDEGQGEGPLALSISVTDSTPLSLRLPQDDLPASTGVVDVDQIDPDLIAATAEDSNKCLTPKASAPSSQSTPNNVAALDVNKGSLNSRRKGAVFVHKGSGNTLPTNFQKQRGASPSRYGTLSGAFAVVRKGEEKNEAMEQNKLIIRVYTYALNIMTILQYDCAIHSTSAHFRPLVLRCLNALLACTGEDKARTLMRPMFMTLVTKLGTKKVLDRNSLGALSWQNLFPLFELVKTYLFRTFTFNIMEEAKIRGLSHDRKRAMSRTPSTSSSPITISGKSGKLPAPFAAWGHEEGFVVDLLPGVDVMGDMSERRLSVDPTRPEDPVLGFENGEYGFHLDAQGYYGDIALAERCAYLLRQKGLHEPVDESLPGVTPKDVLILKEGLSWFEFFEDATELLKALPPPVCSERGDFKMMTERLNQFDLVMDGKTLKKFCEAPKEARRSMLKKIKEGPKTSRIPFLPRRSKNNISVDFTNDNSNKPSK